MAKVEGRERLKRKFAAMPKAVRKAVTDSLIQSAKELNAFQRRLVPKDTGALAASIRYEPESEGETFRVAIKAGGTPQTKREVRKGSGIFTDEAILKEFGTKPHEAAGKFRGALIPAEPAQPFFYPPYRAMKKQIRARVSRAIGKAVKQVASQG